jgi:hypothetical protein
LVQPGKNVPVNEIDPAGQVAAAGQLSHTWVDTPPIVRTFGAVPLAQLLMHWVLSSAKTLVPPGQLL